MDMITELMHPSMPTTLRSGASVPIPSAMVLHDESCQLATTSLNDARPLLAPRFNVTGCLLCANASAVLEFQEAWRTATTQLAAIARTVTEAATSSPSYYSVPLFAPPTTPTSDDLALAHARLYDDPRWCRRPEAPQLPPALQHLAARAQEERLSIFSRAPFSSTTRGPGVVLAAAEELVLVSPRIVIDSVPLHHEPGAQRRVLVAVSESLREFFSVPDRRYGSAAAGTWHDAYVDPAFRDLWPLVCELVSAGNTLDRALEVALTLDT